MVRGSRGEAAAKLISKLAYRKLLKCLVKASVYKIIPRGSQVRDAFLFN